MPTVAHYFLLYVDSPATSANFYSRLLDTPPLELNPTFALFMLDNGVKLGLWWRHTVEPAARMTGGGGEVGFCLPDQAAVETLHAQWVARGATIIQSPTPFGFRLHLCRSGPRRPPAARVLPERLTASGPPG